VFFQAQNVSKLMAAGALPLTSPRKLTAHSSSWILRRDPQEKDGKREGDMLWV